MQINDDEVRIALNAVSKELNLSIDEYIGFDPEGPLPDSWRPRVAEFIGYYLMRASTIHPGVKPHLAGLIVRSIELSILDSDTRALADEFLRFTREEWVNQVPGQFGDGLGDFLRLYDEERDARLKLSEALGLRAPALDWAFVNKDQARVVEFITFFKGHREALSDSAKNKSCSVDIAFHRRSIATSNVGRRNTIARTGPSCHSSNARYFPWTYVQHTLREPSLNDFSYHASYNPRRIISEQLGLEFPAVGWTRFNASSSRAMEFINTYLDGWKIPQPFQRQVWLGDLALASLDVVLRNRDLASTEQEAAERLIREHRGDQAGNLARWARSGCKKLVDLITDSVLTGAHGEGLQDELYGFYECEEAGKAGYIVTFYLNCAFGVYLF